MHEPARFNLMDLIWPVIVLLLALGVRSWYLVKLADYLVKPADNGNTPTLLPRTQEDRTAELRKEMELARQQNELVGWGPWARQPEPSAFSAPGYRMFSFAVYQIPGEHTADERWKQFNLVMRWTQCALGGLAALCWCLLARRLFHSQVVSVLAGLFCAFHPFWIVSTAELNDGVLTSFLLSLCLLLGTIGGRSGGPFTSLAFGLLLAALSLVRAALLPFAFIALLWYLWQCRRAAPSWVSAVLLFLGFINGLVPWMVRNFQTFHDVFPIVDSTYYHLWVGNNPLATGGPMPESEQTLALALQKGVDVEHLSNDEREQELKRMRHEMSERSEPRRYDSLAPYVYRQILDYNMPRRRLWAGLSFWFGEDWLKDEPAVPDAAASFHWLVRAWPGIVSGMLLGMFVLGVLGWRLSGVWAREGRLVTLALAWCFLPYMLSHGERLHGPRLPLDGLLLSYAAFALVAWLPRVGKPLLHRSQAR